MVTKVQRWGNSLGVRLPRAVARDLGVEAGVEVDVRARGGEIVLRPVRRRAYRLAELLAGLEAANRHGEADWGPSAGGEAW